MINRCMTHKLRRLMAMCTAALAMPALSYNYSAGDYAANPVSMTGGSVDPFVMINLSVDQSQQGAAYNDAEQSYAGGTVCPGRPSPNEGICYSPSETYLGYFDPDKCYDYELGNPSHALQSPLSPELVNNINPPHFYPVGQASNRQCAGLFSGNYMNWATMTALDTLRLSITGGARLLDSQGGNAKTILARAMRKNADNFVVKKISLSGFSATDSNGIVRSFSNNPNDVSPFAVNQLFARSEGLDTNTVAFFDANGSPLSYKGLTEFHVNVRMCDSAVGLESCCVAYSDGTDTWHKPEGLLQKNAQKVRFALGSYTSANSASVLRAEAKYIGFRRPAANTTGVTELNPNAEINESGQFIYDPDNRAGIAGVSNSGIINFINNHGLSSGYAQADPMAELFFQGLQYFQGQTPVSASPAITGDDGFPVMSAVSSDAITDACQANFMLTIGDQFHNAPLALPLVPTPPSASPNASALVSLAYAAKTQDQRSDLPGDQFIQSLFIDTEEYRLNAPLAEQNMLWLASLYGGFTDVNGNNTPDINAEWDENSDSNPDNYLLNSQPENVTKALESGFSEIEALLGAGAAAGVVSNSAPGEGLVVQSLFKPSLSDNLGNRITWGGTLQALFVDDFGNLREDSDANGEITNADTVITYVTDPVTSQVKALRSATGDGGASFTPINTQALIDITELNGVWNARDALANLGNVSAQRSYSTAVPSDPSSASRHIFTALDIDGNGIVVPASSADSQIDFVADEFPSGGGISTTPQQLNNFRLLGLSDANKALSGDIVNYVRGEDISGMRSRTIDYDGDGSPEVWRLGDIVSSSPLLVGPPVLSERYDLLYGDDSYREFYEQYRNRRQVVYVGANDGMLHAFNAGFYDSADKKYVVSQGQNTPHPLGAELWAYVPYNLLPHLRWLTEVNSPHVFYVDGEPQTFDVNIFPDDADHPGGWGTILVVGMRFGGGEFTLDPDSDLDTDTSDDITLRSAYMVLDVTNPESPPKLLAEISHQKLGYTVSRPAVAKARVIDDNGNVTRNEWYLVMGSGPYGSDQVAKTAALNRAVSQQKANVFVFDLKGKFFVPFNNNSESYLQVADVDDGFTGDFITMDWDRDFIDDVVYFGTVTSTDLSNPTGDFWRLPLREGNNLMNALSSNDFSRTVENSGGSLGLPVSGRAYAYKHRGKHWVAFGTGRFYVDEDAASQKPMRFFGFKEPVDNAGELTWGGVDLANGEMIDTTNIQPQFIVSTEDPWDGKIFDASNGSDSITLNNGVTVTNYPEYRDTLHQQNPGGWFFDFSSPFTKQIGAVVGDGPVILFSEYQSNPSACSPLGTSNISQLYLGTGHAAPFFALNRKVPLYGELVQDRYIIGGSAIVGKVKELAKSPQGDSVAQSNTGEILSPFRLDKILFRSGTVSWREIPVNWK